MVARRALSGPKRRFPARAVVYHWLALVPEGFHMKIEPDGVVAGCAAGLVLLPVNQFSPW